VTSAQLASACAALIALLGAAPRAFACSPLPCREAWVRPSDGATVAPNLVTIEYEPGSDLMHQSLGLEAERVKTFELLSENGEKIAVTAEPAPGPSSAYWLKPVRALEPHRTYRMRFERPCGEGAPWIEQQFQTGDEAPVPAQLGDTPRVTSERNMRSVPTASGSCTTEITAEVAHVELDLAPGWERILPLTRVSVLVDGKAWTELAPSDASAPLETEVVAGCEVRDHYAYGYVEPGKHKLELRARLAGQSAQPEPVELELDLSCGTPAADGGMPSTPSAGCSVVTSARAPAAGWLGAMLCALLGVCVRRARKA
jgi:hypothetical protein